IPAHHSRSCAALRLVSAGRVPSSVTEAARVLKEPVGDFRALDDAVLNQFGLPLWPSLSATRRNEKVALLNDGIGAALAVRVQVEEQPVPNAKPATSTDLLPGRTATPELPGALDSLDVHFEKFGRTHHLRLPIVAAASPVETVDRARGL